MSKSILIMETPSCCEECRFSDYELPKRCRLMPVKNAKIDDRFSKRGDCPLRELPEYISGEQRKAHNMMYKAGYNACLDNILDN